MAVSVPDIIDANEQQIELMGKKLRARIDEVMTELRKLLEEGRLTPVIDRTFPLGQAREALSYLQSGGGAGRILVAPRQSENVDPAPLRGSEPPL